MALAPFIATIADQVPRFQRGKVTALLGIAQNAGIVGGVYVASWFGSSLILMFVLPAVIAIVVAIVFCLVLPDKVLPAKPPAMTLRDWAETFWVNPAKHPDFSMAWWSRFLITFASFGFTTFRFAYMGHHLNVPTAEIPALIANTTLVYTAALMITAWIAGMLSDRLGRRKVFVWISTAVFALGTYMLIHIESVTHYYLLEILLGAAWGVHRRRPGAGRRCPPEPDDAGKDLGVFNIANALRRPLPR
ncbi:MAG: MFS transporter [Tessaracoccus sp.]|uniref:MFS transporter n=1 Tax=Tessaracoccus sp. TaxID=1971211 RepID=UPI001EC7187A|nr:MFS transporter [Tessaracoccus sp.]MBK7822913.1 MFS transporter [Tessaracoccus sp.]